MNKLANVLLLVTIWMFLNSPALAAGRMALVIGNSDYQHVSQLPNPKRDASDIAGTLRDIGFTVTELYDADHAALQDALGTFSETAAGAEMAIVYYAGHGIEVNKVNYLIPVDASLATDRRLRFETIALDDVLGAMDGVSGLKMILVDACRNNPFSASMKLTKASRSVGRGLAPVEATAGTVIAYSAKEGTIASDGTGRNSPFAAALLASIDKPGLEVQFLLREVRDSVFTETNGEQEPFISASLPRDPIYLVPPTSSVSAEDSAADKGANSAEDDDASPGSDAQSDWSAIQKSSSVEVLKAFITKHSTDKLYRALAEERLAELISENGTPAVGPEANAEISTATKKKSPKKDAVASVPPAEKPKQTKAKEAASGEEPNTTAKSAKTKVAALPSTPDRPEKKKASTTGKCPPDATAAYRAMKGKPAWQAGISNNIRHPCGKRLACWGSGSKVVCVWRG